MENTKFTVLEASKRLGTLIIKCENEVFEYTCFRVDSYPQGKGNHKPLKVKFTDDIEIDCTRRDFTVNSLYYDILNDKIIDFLNGKEDLKNKLLKTTRNPELVFSEDALRIMRLVRFAGQLNFSIEENTYQKAKKFTPLLKDISFERIWSELISILYSDKKYNISNNNFYDNFLILKQLGILKLIFGDIDFDLMSHLWDCSENIRIYLLLLSIKNDNINNVKKLKIPNIFKKNVSKILKFDSLNVDKIVLVENFINNKEFLKLYLDYLKSVKKMDRYKQFKSLYDYIISNNLPFSVKELKIQGSDLLEVEAKKRGIYLKEILIKTILENNNTLEYQKSLLKELK